MGALVIVRDKGRLDSTQGVDNADAAAETYCPTCDSSFPITEQRCPRDGSPLVRFPARAETLVGREIDGRFRVRERIGGGGMGAVYRAWQASVDREVAVKVIHPRLAHQRAIAKRFLREARLASRLSHPNIVVIHDFGQTDDGLLYLVMELVEGETLSTILRAGAALPPRRAVDIAVQLCDALDAAHRLDIVHRDLKPSNVIVVDDPSNRDRIKVLDFGLAKSVVRDDGATTVTDSNAVLGTPRYMSPEMIGDGPVGARSDLYSLGVLLYEMVQRRGPFHAATTQALLAKHLYDEPPPLDSAIPLELRQIIGRLLRKRPADRFANAAEARRALEAARETMVGDTRLRAPAPPAADEATTRREPARPAPSSVDISIDVDSAVEDAAPGRPVASRGRRRAWAVVAVACALATVAAAYVATREPATTPAPAATRAPAVRAHLTPADASAPPSATAAATAAATEVVPAAQPPPALPASVTLRLSAEPRARVTIDGDDLGWTPVAHPLARGDDPVTVVFRRRGYRAARRSFVPRADGALDVALDRAPKPRRRAKPEPAGGDDDAPPPPADWVLPKSR